MCLTISFDHSRNATGLAVGVADKDYLVWKKLTGAGRSPYQGFKYTFGALVSARLSVHSLVRTVRDGLHCMRTRRVKGKWQNSSLRAGYLRWHPAVIPKGSCLYYGTDGDVVSDRLIVYRDMDHLHEVYQQTS